jgi:chorismate dehydratase
LGLRISLVSYLNAAPLGWYFLHGPAKHDFQIVPDWPAKCAERLAAGEVDVGLIPSIEYQRIPQLRVIPDIAIAATHEVRSVLLVQRFNSEAIRTVALDTSSRTSVALTKLLLQSRMGLRPKYLPHKPDVSEMLRKCDAALIIGDAALHCNSDEYQCTDLAAAWREWQARPFVFAFWACRDKAAETKELAEIFLAAKEWGMARIEEIAAYYSSTLKLPVEFLIRYLRYNLDHNLGPAHKEGLERFYRLAFEAGLIEELKPVNYLI